MANNKKSFVIHLDSLDVIDEFTFEQKAALLDAIRDYHLGNEIKLTGLMKAVFVPFKNQFDRDRNKYDKIVERNRKNGSKGGRPEKPKKPNGLNGIPIEPRKADSDSDSDSENESESKTNTSALGFLKSNCPSRFETDFEMKHKSQIQNFKKFTEDFNDKVVIEGIEFTPGKLFARLGTFSRNWITNQTKFSTEPAPNSHESGKQKRA